MIETLLKEHYPGMDFTFNVEQMEYFIEFCISIALYWNSTENSLPELEEIRRRAVEEYEKYLKTDCNYIDEYINAVKPNF